MENSTSKCKRQSMSFGPDEVLLLNDIVTLLCSTDSDVRTRSAWPMVSQKIVHMKARMLGAGHDRESNREARREARQRLEQKIVRMALERPGVPRQELSAEIAGKVGLSVWNVMGVLRAGIGPSRPQRIQMSAERRAMADDYVAELIKCGGKPVARDTITRLAAKHGVEYRLALQVCQRERAKFLRERQVQTEAAE